MTEAALALELRQLRLQVAELPRLVREAVRAELAPLLARLAAPAPMQALVAALVDAFDVGAPFTSSDLVEFLGGPALPERLHLRAALDMALAGRAVSRERVGVLLARLARDGVQAEGCRIATPGREGGSRIWLVQRVGR